jgi:hypothetical protein
MRLPSIVAVAIACLITQPSFGQLLRRSVPQCQSDSAGNVVCYSPIVFQAQPVAPAQSQLSVPSGVEEVSTAVADGPHCRALVNGSCGSGTICGADADGAFVLSNAHVWGTTIGKQVVIDTVVGGATKRLSGRIVFAGYSSSRMVDFAIAYFEGLASKRYMPMLKTEPTDAPFSTTGAPRCVWPLVTKQFNDPRNYGQGLITGSPDAIGGQSGSAIYNKAQLQIALLTWSINGRCAGQKTSKLWEVASSRNTQLADPRPEGLQELAQCDDSGVSTRPETEEGIHGEMPALFAAAEERADDTNSIVGRKVRPLTEDVIASNVASNMAEMPIWYEPGQPDPDPDTDPNPDDDCHKLSDKEWELIQFLRAQSAEQARRGGGEKAIDWAQLIKLILEIIKLIQSQQG